MVGSKIRVIAVALVAASLSGCHREMPLPAGSTQSGAATPTAAESEAAKLLSLSGAVPSKAVAGYEGAVQCAGTINSVDALLGGSPLLAADQLAALRKAAQVYRSRAGAFGSGGNKTAKQVDADVANAAAEARSDSVAASRTMIECLRSLGAHAGPKTVR